MDKEKPELSELENMELEESDEFEEDEETDILDSPSGITAHPGTFLIEVFVDSQRFGHLMLSPKGCYLISNAEIDNGYTPKKLFLFQQVIVEPPKALLKRDKDVKTAAFRSIYNGTYMSRGHLHRVVRPRRTLGTHETFNVTSEKWISFKNGWTNPSLFYACLAKHRNLVLCSTPFKDEKRICGVVSFNLVPYSRGDAPENSQGMREDPVKAGFFENMIEGVRSVIPSGPARLESSHKMLDKITPFLKEWTDLSDYLESKQLRKLKIPTTITVEENAGVYCPHFANSQDQLDEDCKVVSVNVLKRFNSRKIPHMLDFTVKSGKSVKFLFKQNDDIAMDVAVMTLFKYCNVLWKRDNLPAKIRTYSVIATHKLTGFCEIIPGDTLLHYSHQDIGEFINGSPERLENLMKSVAAACVTTAAFMITDRHHNNVMLSPEGEVNLIDLSASLGKKAAMENFMKFNPVYLPPRLLIPIVRRPDHDPLAMEQLFMNCYYCIIKSPEIIAFCSGYGWALPSSGKFLYWLNERESAYTPVREGIRNKIVETMDENVAVNNAVSIITSVIPMN